MNTYRLWLEPDERMPQFKRLKAEEATAGIVDVLNGGVHPAMGPEHHSSVIDGLLTKLNKAKCKFAELEEHGYCHDVNQNLDRGGYRLSLEAFMGDVQRDVLFAEDLSFRQLIDFARDELRKTWSKEMAYSLAQSAYVGFSELRDFLKKKNPALKIRGHADVFNEDLSRFLSVDDFVEFDSLLIHHCFRGHPNFRKASALSEIANDQGLLRLVPSIDQLTLRTTSEKHIQDLVLRASRRDERWQFVPEIGGDDRLRVRAKAFAKQWRDDSGELCFQASTGKLAEMVDSGVVEARFPTLNYCYRPPERPGHADVPHGRVETFCIGRRIDHGWTAEQLRDVLREYGVAMTGNKAKLVQKIAALAAEQYGKRQKEMDEFFTINRFIRIAAVHTKATRLPLLEDEPTLRPLLLSMYAIKHLRGNAVLDVAHDNNTYTVEQLAHALLTRKVGLSGSFLHAG